MISNLFKTLVIVACLLVQACAGGAIQTSYALGEYQNSEQTKSKRIQLATKVNNNYKLYARVDFRKAENGKTDDSKYSLIDGDEWFVGAGVHSYSDTQDRSEARILLNNDTYLIELEDKRLVWRKLGLITGFNHRNRYQGGRKTTGANIGFYAGRYSVNWFIRNNTKNKTDDYLMFSYRRQF